MLVFFFLRERKDPFVRSCFWLFYFSPLHRFGNQTLDYRYDVGLAFRMSSLLVVAVQRFELEKQRLLSAACRRCWSNMQLFLNSTLLTVS